MTFIPDLAEIQIGKESTWGTGVTPTAKLMSIETCKIRPITQMMIHSSLGSLGPSGAASVLKIDGEASIGGEAVYEDLPYWLDSLFGEATPTGSDPYVYGYAAPLTTEPTPRIMTLVQGDNAGNYVYGLEGALVNKLVISGKSGEAIKWSADLIGENGVPDSLAALSDRTVNGIMAAHMDLYIDAWGGTIGSTQITTTFFSFELTLNAARATYHGIGSVQPKGYREAKYTGTLKLSLEMDSTSQGYLDAIIAGSAAWQRQVRLSAANGANLGLDLDFAGTAIKAPELFTDQDGVVTVDLELESTYNPTLTNWFEAEVTNQVSTLP